MGGKGSTQFFTSSSNDEDGLGGFGGFGGFSNMKGGFGNRK